MIVKIVLQSTENSLMPKNYFHLRTNMLSYQLTSRHFFYSILRLLKAIFKRFLRKLSFNDDLRLKLIKNNEK